MTTQRDTTAPSARWPGAHQAFAAVIGLFGKLHAMAPGHGFGEPEGGAAGAVLLLVVVGFDDFVNVSGWLDRGRRLAQVDLAGVEGAHGPA